MAMSLIPTNFKHVLRVRSILPQLSGCLYRYRSSRGNSESEPARITVTDDGNIIVAWHPRPNFPYQHSRPLPEVQEELKEGDSVMKIQYRMDAENMYKKDGPNDEELQMLTYTNKKRWSERYRTRRRIVPLAKNPREGP